MSNKKQTAVYWLAEQIEYRSNKFNLLKGLFDQAKEMERQQIIDACNQIEVFGADHELPGEQYYKEKYEL